MNGPLMDFDTPAKKAIGIGSSFLFGLMGQQSPLLQMQMQKLAEESAFERMKKQMEYANELEMGRWRIQQEAKATEAEAKRQQDLIDEYQHQTWDVASNQDVTPESRQQYLGLSNDPYSMKPRPTINYNPKRVPPQRDYVGEALYLAEQREKFGLQADYAKNAPPETSGMLSRLHNLTPELQEGWDADRRFGDDMAMAIGNQVRGAPRLIDLPMGVDVGYGKPLKPDYQLQRLEDTEWNQATKIYQSQVTNELKGNRHPNLEIAAIARAKALNQVKTAYPHLADKLEQAYGMGTPQPPWANQPASAEDTAVARQVLEAAGSAENAIMEIDAQADALRAKGYDPENIKEILKGM